MADLSSNGKRQNTLKLRRMGIDTHQETVVYMRSDCPVCRSEGLASHAQVNITHAGRSLVAMLHHVSGDILGLDEAGLSEAAWAAIGAHEGDEVHVAHPAPLES